MTCPCPCFKLMAPPHVRMVANSDTTCDDVRKANEGMADKRRNSLPLRTCAFSSLQLIHNGIVRGLEHSSAVKGFSYIFLKLLPDTTTHIENRLWPHCEDILKLRLIRPLGRLCLSRQGLLQVPPLQPFVGAGDHLQLHEVLGHIDERHHHRDTLC